MSLDPCSLLPFADSTPVSLSPRHHAVHHVVGRIWRHHTRFLPPLRLDDPSRNAQGCDAHVVSGGVRSIASPRRLPALKPAIPALAGATVFGGGAWAVFVHLVLRPPHPITGHARHGMPPLPVPEPESILLLLGGLAVLALVRMLARNRRA